MNTVVLFGAGSSVIGDIEETCARLGIEVAAIVRNIAGKSYAIAGDKLVEIEDFTADLRTHPICLPMFTPGHRKSALAAVRALGATRDAGLVDPTAVLPKSCKLGAGVYVNAGVVMGSAAEVGDHVFINRSASLGHHLRLEDFVSIGPAAVVAGHVTIKRGAVIGTGAMVLPEIVIGENAVVGGGSVVTSDVPAGCVAFGNPARVVKRDIAGYNGVGV